jgi:hypothetical protein
MGGKIVAWARVLPRLHLDGLGAGPDGTLPVPSVALGSATSNETVVSAADLLAISLSLFHRVLRLVGWQLQPSAAPLFLPMP